MEIVIGTKQWSSWSMRPWLVLKHAGVAFDERVVPLRHHGSAEAVAAQSPSGLVPALRDGDLVIWDSLAICEYLAERLPDAHLWPADRAARALARSACAEMHSGFASLRGECAMELAKPPKAVTLSELTHENIRRLIHLLGDLRARFGAAGDFLCGDWSIADAYFTPVATRFRTYGVQLSDFGDRGEVGRYMEALLEAPEFRDWEQAALQDAGAA